MKKNWKSCSAVSIRPQQNRHNNSAFARTAFTLVELMIVVSILGILAAIVLPEFQGHAQQAKESAVKSDLRLFREAIERYAADHNGIPPGFPLNNTSAAPDRDVFVAQMTTYSTTGGATNASKTATYKYGPYLNAIPNNPFTNSNFMIMIPSGNVFPSSAWNNFGWIYKPATKEIRIDYFAPDSQNKQIYEY